MAGSLKTLNIYQNGSNIYHASTFISYGIWTDGNKIYKTNNDTPQSGDTELVTLTTPISGLYHNADDEQVSVGLNTVLVITTIAATYISVYCVNASIKTTLDLSTLPDISDGTHTVKIKAKADGYRDSEFSNEVSYTKSSGFTLNVSKWMADIYNGGLTYYKAGTAPTYSTDGDSVGSFELSEPTTIYIWTDSSTPQQKYWIGNNEYITPVYPNTATYTVSDNTNIRLSAGNIT